MEIRVAASVVDSRYAAVSAREAAARTDQPRGTFVFPIHLH